MIRRVVFYRDRRGGCQPCDYARMMTKRHQAKLKRAFLVLREAGEEISREYGKRLRNGVWELRVNVEHHNHRFLYGFVGRVVLVTSAFLKKTDAVPRIEIERARLRLKDWEEQYGAS